jgi:uncharacterized protein (TIGR03435 family)
MRSLITAVVLSMAAWGQAAEFEAVSVKVHQGGGGTTRQMNPGSLRYLNITLGEFMTMSYGVKRYQIDGPDWAVNNSSSVRFDIVAKAAESASPEEMRKMLGAVLEDRFQLRFHREQRDLPVYALTVLKGGPKFKEGDGGEPGVSPNGSGAVAFKNYPMEALALLLSNMPAVGKPVIDRTGLTGKYTFTTNLLDTAPGGADVKSTLGADADPVTAPILSNLQVQLGLKLEAAKAPLQMIVIDHVEKTPTGN